MEILVMTNRQPNSLLEASIQTFHMLKTGATQSFYFRLIFANKHRYLDINKFGGAN